MRRLVLAAIAVALVPVVVVSPPPDGNRLPTQQEPLDAFGNEVSGVGWAQERPATRPFPTPVWPTSKSMVVLVDGRSTEVEVLSQGDGLLMKVPVAGEVTVPYASYRYASGGDWADRLKLWQVGNGTATPLKTVNNPSAGTVSARIERAGLVAVAASSSGGSGNFAATSLAASATWSAGGNSGGFSWTYPMRIPPAPGLQPTVSLSYSSSSVDGRSEATNNQPSIIGEGFEYAPGFIERRYVPCSEDQANGGNNSTKTGDQCWRTDNATMSLSGSGGELVFETGKGWHTRSEDGSRVEKLSGASNGDENGEYWKVTTNDGTQYFFGLNNLPGQSTTTESTFVSPVYGNHSGEPCNAGTFANSSCVQAYRWNLDYMVDVRGNTMSFWYEKESNNYARNNTDSNTVAYTRNGVLRRIDYGTYYRTAAEHGVDQVSIAPVGQVLFEYADRCFANCWNGSTPVKESWQDTPVDQKCDGTTCQYKYSPTFWTMKRLWTVTTKVAGVAVDKWELAHSFPPTGDGGHPGLWLNSIVHTGLLGGSTALPPITFQPVSLPNRVLTMNNTSNNWQRISNIVTETGGKIHVDYSLPECTSSNLPAAAHTNTMRCYPVIGDNQLVEWWHKYVVTDVFEQDVPLANGRQAATKHTSYEYGGGGVAWRYADDDGLSKPDRRTWSQYRGYSQVKVRTGDAPNQTLQVTTYLRGMHGDRADPSGGTLHVPVPASLGTETVYDEDTFAGMAREQVVYNGVESKPVSKTVNVPWRSTPTATRGAVSARYVGTAVSYSATALGIDGARGWRVSRAQTQRDGAYGAIDWTESDADTSVPGDEKCVRNTYNRNTAKHILTTLKQVTTTALLCDKTPSSVDDVIADVRSYFDGATSLSTPPSFGNVTWVEQLKDWVPGSGTQWQTVSQSTHDSAGRVRTATDIKGGVTTTTYTPAIGGPVTKVETVGPAPFNFKSTSEFNPAWGTTWRSIDANGKVTGSAEFDALGRTRRVWQLGWNQADNPTRPSVEYDYVLAPNRDSYAYVKTQTLNAKGNYVPSYQIFDGLLRLRQTQGLSLNNDGGRVVADTIYDEHGRAATTYASHAEPGAPSGTLWWEPEWSVPTVKRVLYDRASRAETEVLLSGDEVTNLVEKFRITTTYEGDRSKKTPPAGGIVTTTVVDALGRTTEILQPGVKLEYRYDRRGTLAKYVDTAKNEWTYGYDAKGRKKTEKDPDKGTTTFEYNDANELIKTTDANGEVLFTVYDEIGRKRELRDDSATGALRAEWKYDTLYSGQSGFKGQPTQAIRYEPAGSSNAYKWQVRQMNGRYQVTGYHYVIPTAEAGLAGTYVYGQEFSGYNGVQTSTTYPAAGDLPTEKVTTNFNATNGLAIGLNTGWGGVDSTMLTTTYNAYGQPVEHIRKPANGLFVQDTIEYYTDTGRVKRTRIKPESSSTPVSDRQYTYDGAGNPAQISDLGDLQCFRYDTLARLDRAWTPGAGRDCTATASVANMGGPAPYFNEWGFDPQGNKTSETSHASSGDVVRGYTLPAGGQSVVRPHAVTSMTVGGTTTSYGYDAVGNMTTRGNQTLRWTAENKLDTVWVGTSLIETNIYDANGQRLVRRDVSGSTLYLPGQEIRREGTVNRGTRYYTSGTTIATRTGSGLTWVYDNHQATQQFAINAATQSVTTRRQTPYGAPRGNAPTWVNQKGFVGGENDPTGLVNIGARQYDPALGRFVSVDPMLVADDPAQFDAYQYGAHNPIGKSDPTGTCVVDDVTGKCDHATTKKLQEQHRNSKSDSVRKFCDAACFLRRNRENSVVFGRVDQAFWAHKKIIDDCKANSCLDELPGCASKGGSRFECDFGIETVEVDEFGTSLGALPELMISDAEGVFNGNESLDRTISRTRAATERWASELGKEFSLGFSEAGLEGSAKLSFKYSHGTDVTNSETNEQRFVTPPGMSSYLAPNVSIVWKARDHYATSPASRERVYLGRTISLEVIIKGSSWVTVPNGEEPFRRSTPADVTKAVVGRLDTIGHKYQ